MPSRQLRTGVLALAVLGSALAGTGGGTSTPPGVSQVAGGAIGGSTGLLCAEACAEADGGMSGGTGVPG